MCLKLVLVSLEVESNLSDFQKYFTWFKLKETETGTKTVEHGENCASHFDNVTKSVQSLLVFVK